VKIYYCPGCDKAISGRNELALHGGGEPINHGVFGYRDSKTGKLVPLRSATKSCSLCVKECTGACES